jgi:enediyne biosynthesis protein E4
MRAIVLTAVLTATGALALPDTPLPVFTDVTAASGVKFTHENGAFGKKYLPETMGSGVAFFDADGDGWQDLFFVNSTTWPGQPAKPSAPALYRNNHDGTFTDVTAAAGLKTTLYGFGAAAADFDNDGWPDIYVACDTTPSLLYRNNKDGTFREVGIPAGCAFDAEGTALAGMGVGVGDYDNDGWLDIVRTNFSEQVTTLYRNYGGAFEEVSLRAGLGVNRKYLGFGVDFFDFDNDGWADIFLANGHVYSQIANKKLHLKYREPKVLYRNLGNGRFEDVSAKAGPAILAENLGRGCAFGDFDNDGDVDVLVNNLDGPPTLLRNDGGSGNHSLLIKCVGTRSNRSAIGARVTITAAGRDQIGEVMSGSGYYSQNDLRLHFGLGRAASVERVEVAWPSGAKETLRDLAANQLFVIQESKGIVSSRKPG